MIDIIAGTAWGWRSEAAARRPADVRPGPPVSLIIIFAVIVLVSFASLFGEGAPRLAEICAASEVSICGP